MADYMRLGHAIDRFNQGCAAFNRAIRAWHEHRLADYQNGLRRAATEVVGALELGLKSYLRFTCRPRLTPDEFATLKAPNFDDLMNLMQKYAAPPLDPILVPALYGYRELLRNPAEHEGSVPDGQMLCQAIGRTRRLLLTYLPIQDSQLSNPTDPEIPDPLIPQRRRTYYNSLREQFEYMDLGGISPRVGSKVVKIRMTDLFIPVHAVEDAVLLESFEGETSPATAALGGDFPWQGENTSGQVFDPESSPRLPQSRRYPIDIGRILERSRVVILGHPGSGKTTVGRYLAYSIASESEGVSESIRQHIPVLVRAAEYAWALKTDPSMSLYNYVTTRHSTTFGPLFAWALEAGRCLLIVDGLDEVPDPQFRSLTARRVEQLVSEFHQNRFVITSRIVGYRQNQLSGDFFHVTLAELSPAQIQAFLTQWYRAVESETSSRVDQTDIQNRASQLWNAIKANPGIRKLAGNPLLLTIIALANFRGTKLPSRRVELYQIATETLIENWPLKQRNLTFNSAEVLALLEPIANYMFVSGRTNLVAEHELRPLFESQVCEVRGVTPAEAKAISRELLQMIEQHTGFFLERGIDDQGQSVYGFLHLTFAEYLTARHLAAQWSERALDLGRYAHDPRWHEVVLLMAGHIGSWAPIYPTQLVRDILELGSPHEAVLHRDLLLAAEVLEENIRVKREVQDVIVERLIRIALSTQYGPLWFAATNTLVEIQRIFGLGGPYKLAEASVNDSPEILLTKALLRVAVGDRSEEVLRTMFQGLSSYEDYGSRITLAIETLADWEDGSHLLVVVTPTMTQTIPLSSQTATFVSRVTPTRLSIQQLLAPMPAGNASRSGVGILTGADLLAIGAREIARLLQQNEDWETRRIVGLGLRLDTSWKAMVTALLEVVDGRNVEESVAALNALEAVFEDPEFGGGADESAELSQQQVEALLTLAESNKEWRVRVGALRAILELSSEIDEKVYALLETALEDPDPELRLAATHLVGEFAEEVPKRLLAQLRERVDDRDPGVRRASAQILLRLGQAREEDVSILLDRACEAIGDDSGREALGMSVYELTVLASRARGAHVVASLAARIAKQIEIEGMRRKEVEPWELSLLLHERGRYRPKPEVAEAASQHLNNPNPMVRFLAVFVWGVLRATTDGVDRLLVLMRDPDERVRAAAVRVVKLEDMNRADVRGELLKKVADDAAEVALGATVSLTRIREPEGRAQVADWAATMVAERGERSQAFNLLWGMVHEPRAEWVESGYWI